MSTALEHKLPRPTDEPDGETCRFCGKKNDFWDDCGFFYINPDPKIKEQRAVCEECYFGRPGRAHVARFGLGER